MSIPSRIRRAVYERDGGVCVHCGREYMLTTQHRANRGMGGRKSGNQMANLITLCLPSNQRLESDAEFAELGRRNGWKISSWQDPESVPVAYPSGGHFYIYNNGTRVLKEK